MNKKEMREFVKKVMEEKRSHGGTVERNEFNAIEKDLQGDELKVYNSLKRKIMSESGIYEPFRVFNLALLDLIFDKEVEMYSNLTLEDKVKCFEYDMRDKFYMSCPSTMEDFYISIKNYVFDVVMHPENVLELYELRKETMIEENEDIN